MGVLLFSLLLLFFDLSDDAADDGFAPFHSSLFCRSFSLSFFDSSATASVLLFAFFFLRAKAASWLQWRHGLDAFSEEIEIEVSERRCEASLATLPEQD